MVKLVCIIPSLSIGGMERVMSVLLKEFSKKNIEIHLILYGKNRAVDYTVPENVIIHKPSFNYSDTNRFIFTLKTVLFIRNEIKAIKPNSILSFGEYWNNLVLLSLIGLNFKVYISDRSQPNKNLGKIQNKLRNFLYPKAAGYIAQTSKAEDIAINNKWNSKTIVIGNPINMAIECNPDECNPEHNREKIILTVGRLIPSKHIDELIKIFSIVDPKDWKLMIVGGDSKNMNLSSQYKKLIDDLKLNDRIFLEGTKANVSEYYKRAEIFAFTSSSEGFPNVIGEAMSYGLPVISYDCNAGPSDLINDGETGFLIQGRDQELFISNLKKLIDSQDLRRKFGKNGMKKICEFEASNIAEKYFKFITDPKSLR